MKRLFKNRFPFCGYENLPDGKIYEEDEIVKDDPFSNMTALEHYEEYTTDWEEIDRQEMSEIDWYCMML